MAKRDSIAVLTRATSPAYPRRPSRRLDAVNILARDDTRLAAEICDSPLSPASGVVVFVHGFAGSKHESGLFQTLAAYALLAGYHTVLYDWRGIGESQGTFSSTAIEAHVADFEDVTRWVQRRFPASSNGLFAVGFSLGAAVVGLALRRGTKLNGAAYVSPALRPRLSMWPRYDSDAIRHQIRERGFVEKPGSSVVLGKAILDSLRDTDLGPDALDTCVPLLVCHGTGDERIHYSHTVELVKHHGKTEGFRYRQFGGASHSFRPGDVHWQELASEIITWFDRDFRAFVPQCSGPRNETHPSTAPRRTRTAR